jgi:hypothetical protein
VRLNAGGRFVHCREGRTERSAAVSRERVRRSSEGIRGVGLGANVVEHVPKISPVPRPPIRNDHFDVERGHVPCPI